MPIKVKPVADLTAKFVTRAGAAAQDYLKGVDNPRVDQSQAAIAAAQTWAQGLQHAIANNSFVKGVTKAGSAKWQAMAKAKGGARYGQGVAAAGPAYSAGVAPYIEVLSNLNLPPKGPKGDPGNNARVNAVTAALSARKAQG